MIIVGNPLIGSANVNGQAIQICITTKNKKLITLLQLIYHIGNALYRAACFEGGVKPGYGDEDGGQNNLLVISSLKIEIEKRGLYLLREVDYGKKYLINRSHLNLNQKFYCTAFILFK